MEIARDVLLVLHFVGLASLLGGFLLQMREPVKVVNAAMLHGALTQLVTGVGLVWVLTRLHEQDPAQWSEPDNAKFGVKAAILLAILVLVWVNRRRESVPTGVWALIGLLTLGDIVVAVVW